MIAGIVSMLKRVERVISFPGKTTSLLLSFGKITVNPATGQETRIVRQDSLSPVIPNKCSENIITSGETMFFIRTLTQTGRLVNIFFKGTLVRVVPIIIIEIGVLSWEIYLTVENRGSGKINEKRKNTTPRMRAIILGFVEALTRLFLVNLPEKSVNPWVHKNTLRTPVKIEP